MTNDEVTPELEQAYFVYYSKLSIALGSLMMILVLDDVFEFGGQSIFLYYGFYASCIVTGAVTLFYLFTGNKFFTISFSKNAWTGTYNDEFLNTVNLIAYKSAAFSSIFVAAIGIFAAKLIETETLATAILGTSFFTYGLAALIQLRDMDE